jgi:choline dehydrogenase
MNQYDVLSDEVMPLFKRSEDWEGGASAFRGAGGPIRVERARDLHPVAATFITPAGPAACRTSTT